MSCYFRQLTKPQLVGCYTVGAGIIPLSLCYYYYNNKGDIMRKVMEYLYTPSQQIKPKEYMTYSMCTLGLACGSIGFITSYYGIKNEIMYTKKTWNLNPSCCTMMRSGVKNVFMCSLYAIFATASVFTVDCSLEKMAETRKHRLGDDYYH